jgi:hypothetical protein
LINLYPAVHKRDRFWLQSLMLDVVFSTCIHVFHEALLRPPHAMLRDTECQD